MRYLIFLLIFTEQTPPHLGVRALARGLERAGAPGDPRLAHRGEVLDGHRPLGAPEEAVATRAGLHRSALTQLSHY